MGGLTALAAGRSWARWSRRGNAAATPGTSARVMAVATVGGPLLGGSSSTSWLGWRWMFFICVPLAVIALFVLQPTLHLHTVRRDNVKIDYLGALLIAVGVSLPLLWVSFVGTDSPGSPGRPRHSSARRSSSLALAVLRRAPGGRAVGTAAGSSATAPPSWPSSPASPSASRCSAARLPRPVLPDRPGLQPDRGRPADHPADGRGVLSSTIAGQIISRTGTVKAFLVAGGGLPGRRLGRPVPLDHDTPAWESRRLRWRSWASASAC